MTRWARANNIHKKKLPEATPWSQMKRNRDTGPSKTKAKNRWVKNQPTKDGNRLEKCKRKESEWYHKKEEYQSEDVNGFMDYLKETGQVLHKGTVVSVDSAKVKVDAALALKKDQRRENRRLKRQVQKKNIMVIFKSKVSEGIRKEHVNTMHEKLLPVYGCFSLKSVFRIVKKCLSTFKRNFHKSLLFIVLNSFLPLAVRNTDTDRQRMRETHTGRQRDRDTNRDTRWVPARCWRVPARCWRTPGAAVGNCVLTVGRWTRGMSADYEEIPVTSNTHKAKPKVPKIVNF
uniref:zinc finger CCHC domain-containing protein 9 n=1 Tax=Pristiophorus japonicus TaxID=55135 RepID=UPI00398F39B9